MPEDGKFIQDTEESVRQERKKRRDAKLKESDEKAEPPIKKFERVWMDDDHSSE